MQAFHPLLPSHSHHRTWAHGLPGLQGGHASPGRGARASRRWPCLSSRRSRSSDWRAPSALPCTDRCSGCATKTRKRRNGVSLGTGIVAGEISSLNKHRWPPLRLRVRVGARLLAGHSPRTAKDFSGWVWAPARNRLGLYIAPGCSTPRQLRTSPDYPPLYGIDQLTGRHRTSIRRESPAIARIVQ